MAELTVKADKFKRLLDYIDRIGLDVEQVAGAVSLVPQRIGELSPDVELPALQYARLYRAAALEMQKFRHPIPWGAGIGTEAFEFMCRAIITERTLGGALQVAERYENMLYPMVGYRMRLLPGENDETVRLSYRVNVDAAAPIFAPDNWDRSPTNLTLARASGLIVWCAFCGWLTGRPMELRQVCIDAPPIGDAYFRRLERVFRCPIAFEAGENTMSFECDILQRRLVHSHDSLQDFLDSSVYHLIAVDSGMSSTSAAIKSLVRVDLPGGMPSFASVAQSLHMSESSLRRRLQRENTSYQALKDEIRCELAIDRLLNQQHKVADIAEYLGFTEPSSFVRSFKGWTGETPKSYRDRMQSLSQ